jgi:hypothetical protein
MDCACLFMHILTNDGDIWWWYPFVQGLFDEEESEYEKGTCEGDDHVEVQTP